MLTTSRISWLRFVVILLVLLFSAAGYAGERSATLDLGGGVKMEFVLIPAGSFVMGDADGQVDEKPPHKVAITRPFYLGKYPVTQEQWLAVMGDNPSDFRGPQNPVESIGWVPGQAFLRKLNEKFAARGLKFDLPSEAQWEYACRAGGKGEYSFGDSDDGLGQYAWFRGNSGGTTHPVGQKKPNAWGLYDMHGNVAQFVRRLVPAILLPRIPVGRSPLRIRNLSSGDSRRLVRRSRLQLPRRLPLVERPFRPEPLRRATSDVPGRAEVTLVTCD